MPVFFFLLLALAAPSFGAERLTCEICDHPPVQTPIPATERELRDLAAQEDMARSAELMLTLALLQVVIGAVTILYLRHTIRQNAQAIEVAARNAATAERAVREARETSIRELRAHVFVRVKEDGVEVYHVVPAPGDPPDPANGRRIAPTKMALSLDNHGATPAHITHFDCQAYVCPKDGMPPSRNPRKILGRELPVGLISSARTSHVERVRLDRLRVESVDLNLGRVHLWVVGFVRYRDAFDHHYITGFAYEFDPAGKRWVQFGGEDYNYARTETIEDIQSAARHAEIEIPVLRMATTAAPSGTVQSQATPVS